MPPPTTTPPVGPPVEQPPDVAVDGPVDPVVASAWRQAVLHLRYAERRRVFTPTVHLGDPRRDWASFAVPSVGPRDSPMDHALCCDVVTALLDHWRRTVPEPADAEEGAGEAGAPPFVWLARSGPFERHDEDARWLSAARAAHEEVGLRLQLAVVTHGGWYDPRTGVGRRWKRLRRR